MLATFARPFARCFPLFLLLYAYVFGPMLPYVWMFDPCCCVPVCLVPCLLCSASVLLIPAECVALSTVASIQSICRLLLIPCYLCVCFFLLRSACCLSYAFASVCFAVSRVFCMSAAYLILVSLLRTPIHVAWSMLLRSCPAACLFLLVRFISVSFPFLLYWAERKWGGN